ncbi:hypothetical protein H4R35_005363 [Dimargaris xerosporica]|nr:hypothetical protein H4R35_005363 [Dimargaris xerosporica]
MPANEKPSNNCPSPSPSAAVTMLTKGRKKPGRKPHPQAAEIRKDKNCLAQRNYRKRREGRIKSLEQEIAQLKKEKEDMQPHFEAIIKRQENVIATLQKAATSTSTLSPSIAAATVREPITSAGSSSYQRYLAPISPYYLPSVMNTRSSPCATHSNRFSDIPRPELAEPIPRTLAC